MSRIKKTGLDYFPLDTDFINNRLVRRIMKREGEGALATLICTLSCIYGGEGYYVLADDLFCEDLATNLYHQTAEDVARILRLAVDYGIFDAALFARYGILTSAEIQKQYLFSTKRRKSTAINPLYCIETDLQEDEPAEDQPSAPQTNSQEEKNMYAETHENVTFNPKNVTSDTHSIAQHSKEKPLLNSSPERETLNADRKSAEKEEAKAEVSLDERAIICKEDGAIQPPPAPDKASRREWTADDIALLKPPADGLKRNLDGLIFNLHQYRIPPNEQYAIILKSNFGVIGHPVWKGFFSLRESHGKIRLPGRYLLSLCVARRE